jgi:hypothetical protein
MIPDSELHLTALHALVEFRVASWLRNGRTTPYPPTANRRLRCGQTEGRG